MKSSKVENETTLTLHSGISLLVLLQNSSVLLHVGSEKATTGSVGVEEEKRKGCCSAQHKPSSIIQAESAWVYLHKEGREQTIAKQITGSLDSDGYLRREPEAISNDLAFSTGMEVAPEEVLEVLKWNAIGVLELLLHPLKPLVLLLWGDVGIV